MKEDLAGLLAATMALAICLRSPVNCWKREKEKSKIINGKLTEFRIQTKKAKKSWTDRHVDMMILNKNFEKTDESKPITRISDSNLHIIPQKMRLKAENKNKKKIT